MVMRNLDVIDAFLNRKPSDGPMGTDGATLYSYGTRIGIWKGDEILMPDSTIFHSLSTSRHRNQLRKIARSRAQKVVEA
ncbi:hypothetical protein LCGC14_1521530 [marine sediment metagenome]|uniref:Uncharacterized protein n=1 Tax=marine sediment metagenome TaxID=412755 RepID=A0A0F9LE37_9ZZZZ